MTQRPILIGIAGGTASGKTSVAKAITQDFDRNDIALIEQDSYYRDHSDIPVSERAKINYDHPESFDFALMKQHILDVLDGREIQVPVYDYDNHARSTKTHRFQGQHIIVLEGIMGLFDDDIRKLMDIKIFVDTADDIRILRRMKRDIEERGRTYESVISQYFSTVRPMHLQFIQPTKTWADIIVPQGATNKVAIDLLKTKIKDLLRQKNV